MCEKKEKLIGQSGMSSDISPKDDPMVKAINDRNRKWKKLLKRKKEALLVRILKNHDGRV